MKRSAPLRVGLRVTLPLALGAPQWACSLVDDPRYLADLVQLDFAQLASDHDDRADSDRPPDVFVDTQADSTDAEPDADTMDVGPDASLSDTCSADGLGPADGAFSLPDIQSLPDLGVGSTDQDAGTTAYECLPGSPGAEGCPCTHFVASSGSVPFGPRYGNVQAALDAADTEGLNAVVCVGVDSVSPTLCNARFEGHVTLHGAAQILGGFRSTPTGWRHQPEQCSTELTSGNFNIDNELVLFAEDTLPSSTVAWCRLNTAGNILVAKTAVNFVGSGVLRDSVVLATGTVVSSLTAVAAQGRAMPAAAPDIELLRNEIVTTDAGLQTTGVQISENRSALLRGNKLVHAGASASSVALRVEGPGALATVTDNLELSSSSGLFTAGIVVSNHASATITHNDAILGADAVGANAVSSVGIAVSSAHAEVTANRTLRSGASSVFTAGLFFDDSASGSATQNATIDSLSGLGQVSVFAYGIYARRSSVVFADNALIRADRASTQSVGSYLENCTAASLSNTGLLTSGTAPLSIGFQAKNSPGTVLENNRIVSAFVSEAFNGTAASLGVDIDSSPGVQLTKNDITSSGVAAGIPFVANQVGSAGAIIANCAGADIRGNLRFLAGPGPASVGLFLKRSTGVFVEDNGVLFAVGSAVANENHFAAGLLAEAHGPLTVRNNVHIGAGPAASSIGIGVELQDNNTLLVEHNAAVVGFERIAALAPSSIEPSQAVALSVSHGHATVRGGSFLGSGAPAKTSVAVVCAEATTCDLTEVGDILGSSMSPSPGATDASAYGISFGPGSRGSVLDSGHNLYDACGKLLVRGRLQGCAHALAACSSISLDSTDGTVLLARNVFDANPGPTAPTVAFQASSVWLQANTVFCSTSACLVGLLGADANAAPGAIVHNTFFANQALSRAVVQLLDLGSVASNAPWPLANNNIHCQSSTSGTAIFTSRQSSLSAPPATNNLHCPIQWTAGVVSAPPSAVLQALLASANNVSLEPGFQETDPFGTRSVHLAPGSRLQNLGAPLVNLPSGQDFDGEPQPSPDCPAPDLGCDELQDGICRTP